MQQRNSCEPELAVSEPGKAPQLKVKRSCRHACKEGLPDGIISTHDEDEDDNDADDAVLPSCCRTCTHSSDLRLKRPPMMWNGSFP